MQEVLKLPNLTHKDTPIGDESNAKKVEVWGTPREFEFTPKDHIELGLIHNLFDFEAGSRVTGSKFVYLKNEAALLELKLINWVMGLL